MNEGAAGGGALADARFRRACAHAIDREDLVADDLPGVTLRRLELRRRGVIDHR